MTNFHNILSIDDSKAVHAYLEVCFPKTEYELTHVLDAREGLDMLKNNPKKYSLILLDWEMPGMSGPEALVEIRKLGYTLPVMMVTSKNDPNEIAEMLNKGATEYVMKPFTTDIIKEKVESVLLRRD